VRHLWHAVVRQNLATGYEAVRNAVLEPWHNGQTEGQINRSKTLKRAIYGRAGDDLLRVRMTPLLGVTLHQE
jgi:transposase